MQEDAPNPQHLKTLVAEVTDKAAQVHDRVSVHTLGTVFR